MTTETHILTDPPEIVKLKLEFRDLDAQEETLKERLAGVRRLKQQIAQRIFPNERKNDDPRH